MTTRRRRRDTGSSSAITAQPKTAVPDAPSKRKRKSRDGEAVPVEAPSREAKDAKQTPTAIDIEPQPLFIAPIAVRWRDLDAFNHVNNSSFLTYLEEARLQWLKTVPGTWFDAHSMPVLAASELNYRAPIVWPAQIAVELFRERVGTSSLTIGHRIADATDPSRLYCDGRVVLVWTDPITGKSVALPEAIRSAGVL